MAKPDADYWLTSFFVAHQCLGPLTEKATQEQQRCIDSVLTEYRMAVTNHPLARERIDAASAQLRDMMSSIGGEELVERYDAALIKEVDERAIAIAQAGFDKTTVMQGRDSKRSVQNTAHCVIPGLYVGSQSAAADAYYLRRIGITHVLCLIELQPPHPFDFQYKTIVTADSKLYDMSAHFDEAFQFISRAIAVGGSVLVHCGAGISRAPTIAAAYLIHTLHLPNERLAVEMVKKVRVVANPNEGFLQQLKRYASQLEK